MDILKKEDLDTKEALQLLTPLDLEKLGLSIGQKIMRSRSGTEKVASVWDSRSSAIFIV